MKTFDRALGFSLALHVAVVALWQWAGVRQVEPPAEASVRHASRPVVVSLILPEPSPSAAQTPVQPAAAVAPTRRAAPAAETLAAGSVAATSVVSTSAATAPAPVSAVVPASVAAVVAIPATPALTPAAVELPSTEADYWHNPKPAYPSLSRRLGEQGKVLVRVFIDASGQPQQAEVKQSSGFERLDQTALNTVLKWRYLPGKRNGTPEAMWLQVPLEFRLE
ncbi:MAG: energy transducer TonB [Burkholderiales bacterium]